MSITIKLLFFLFMIGNFIQEGEVTFYKVIVILALLSLHIIKEKYRSNMVTTTLPIIVAGVGALYIDGVFILMIALGIFDFIAMGKYGHAVAIIGGYTYIALLQNEGILLLLVAALSGVCGYMVLMLNEKVNTYQTTLDRERRVRYELEEVKQKLIISTEEAVRFAEVSERTRIARDIHDKVGHKLAGVLLHLQASEKIASKNPEKSKEMMGTSINTLSECLELLRDTVHHLKPKDKVGVEYIEQVIKEFKFCPVEFSFSGDFNTLSSSYVNIIATTIKEGLTNASRHSSASEMIITLEINDVYARVYIKDNGQGCKNVKPGMGLSNMRDRVNSAGGTFSFNGNDGFTIVCVLPMGKGGIVLESINSR